MTKTQSEWEKRFDVKFGCMIEDWGETSFGEENMEKTLDEIKSFIASELAAIRAETIKEVVVMIEELRIGNIPKPPYSSIDREHLCYNQAITDLKEQLEGKV